MHFEKITTKDRLTQVLASLPETVAIDCETTGLSPEKDKLLEVAIAISEDTAYLIPAEFAPLLTPLKTKTLILHNFKFDFRFLYRAGLDLIDTQVYDTVILHHLINEEAEHGLDKLVQTHFQDNYKEMFWNTYKEYEQASDEAKLDYACRDVCYTLALYRLFSETLAPKSDLVTHVHRLAKALLRTEIQGVKVDLDQVISTGDKLKEELSALGIAMRSMTEYECQQWEMSTWLKEMDKRKTDKGKAGVPKPEFNFESSKQLGELLYDILGIPEQQNKQRKRTVDDAAMQNIETKHPLIPLLRDFRDKQKIYGTYVEGLLTRTIDSTIYPEFNVCGTVTGRISSKNPNLQNIPRDNAIRGFFKPREGYKLIGADYGQLEIVLAAHFSQDPLMLELVRSGQSMHDKTAEGLKHFGVTRQSAKTINFGILYGAMEFKIAQVVGCSMPEAKEILNAFWDLYKGLKEIIDTCHKCVEDGKPIVNPFGRERHFGTNFESRWDLERAKRQAFNSLIQGTGADITNRAFYLTSERLLTNKRGRALWSVHDECLIEIDAGYCTEERNALISVMEGVGKEINLTLPLTVDASLPLNQWEK